MSLVFLFWVDRRREEDREKEREKGERRKEREECGGGGSHVPHKPLTMGVNIVR